MIIFLFILLKTLHSTEFPALIRLNSKIWMSMIYWDESESNELTTKK
jgi:hypothetical protein